METQSLQTVLLEHLKGIQEFNAIEENKLKWMYEAEPSMKYAEAK